MANDALPPAAVLITHTVEDFDTWKTVFDQTEPARRAAGILGHHINRAEDDPNRLSIYVAVSDLDAARAFSSSEDLAADMQRAGVTSPPEITWMTPVRESVVWEGEHPAFVVTHRVADFDRWLEGYDAAGDIQRAHGIIGHAANRPLDDPSTVIVYHQAESFDTLRAFLGSSELRSAMEEAGVTSEPQVTFHTGGWAKQYT
jgi:hypothetical protein